VAEMPPGPGGKKNDPNDDPETAWRVFTERKLSDGLNILANKVSGVFLDAAMVRENYIDRPPPSDPLADIGL
jgi:hypothetical protein